MVVRLKQDVISTKFGYKFLADVPNNAKYVGNGMIKIQNEVQHDLWLYTKAVNVEVIQS
jgi:hypothetical protein